MENFKIRKILVPINMSLVSLHALDAAIEIGKINFSRITLIYVVDHYFDLYPSESADIHGGVLTDSIKKANKDLLAICQNVRHNHNIIIDHVVQLGKPSAEVCNWANHGYYDLIVIGKKVVTKWYTLWKASTAYQVVRRSACPVVTIPATSRQSSFNKIIFPVGVRLNAVARYNVIDSFIQRKTASLKVIGIAKTVYPKTLFKVRQIVDDLVTTYQSDYVQSEGEIHYAMSEERQLLLICNKEKPDLIVINADRQSFFSEVLRGSYTGYIIRNSQFPVLSVRTDVDFTHGEYLSN